ncbi:MAG: hypothetical protein A2Y77_10720 [Planctomycetes bacterium RBG_13_62_9]|nr:MAG: hypothetical protein A2Y77_10720 [Planctomycetes bacterium RBG_13_62_9]
MAKLGIELNGNKTVFAPGEPVEGRIEWHLDANPTALELSLLWYTSGKGTRDVGLCGTHRVEHPGSFGSDNFRFTLPPGPYSFSGRLISLIWTLELTSTPGDETVRQEIVLSPTGKEITLPAISPMPSGQDEPS